MYNIANKSKACNESLINRKRKMVENKFSVVCQGFIRGIGILMVGYLFLQGLFTICCVERVAEKTYYIQNNVFVQLLGIVAALVVVRLLTGERLKRFWDKWGHLSVCACLLAVVLFLFFWVYHTQFWYASDMEKIYQNAGLMLEGNYSGWEPGGYLYMWPHQNGLLLLVALLLRFFTVDQSFLVLYGLNIIAFAATVLAMLYSLKYLYKDKNMYCLQTLLLVFYFPYSFFCLMLYGNVLGFAFACVSMALLFAYFEKPYIGKVIGSALCMSVAICLKQNNLIVMIGFLMVLVFQCIIGVGKRKKLGVGILVYLGLVLLCIQIPNSVIEQITGIEVSGGNTRWAHVAMGLMEENATPGWYNGYNEQVFRENGYDKESTAVVARERVEEILGEFAEHPSVGWRFFNYKLASEWSNPTFECFNIQNARSTGLELNSLIKSTINDGGKINLLYIYLFDIVQSAVLFGVLMYLILEKKINWHQLLFCILFIGGFLFFAVWEAKSQYVVYFFFLLIPYCVPGYRMVWKAFKDKQFVPFIVLGAMILFIALSDAQWVQDSFKIQGDTEAYYEYIHQYNQNFLWLRF